ncbi:MAG: DUF262 domain-containing HNH endonuclease family protein [Ignavibacteriaceae bacterium]|nr:DUF262 domain-containing HNH endonuclease family protein [Ignavibacteriaceae bacterium]
MHIDPNYIAIDNLFFRLTEQFIVPAYQRRYSWGLRQLGELFDDINKLKIEDSHLLSSIVFLKGESKGGINQYEIIDGQQRITTLSIIFLSLKEKYLKLNDKNKLSSLDKLLFCEGYSRTSQPKLILGELDNVDYSILLNSKEDDFNKIKNHHLLDAINFYKQKLPDNQNQLDDFYDKISTKLKLIRLDVSSASDAYKLFEVINNRGLKLTASDIIKNFILGNAAQKDDGTNIKNVKESWKNLVVYLDGISIDNFLRHFLSGILKRKLAMSKVAAEFKKYYYLKVEQTESLSEYSFYDSPEDDNEENEEILIAKDNEDDENSINPGVLEGEKARISSVEKIDIKELASDLEKSAEIYAKIYNREFDSEKVNECLRNLSRVEAKPSYSFLLHLFKLNVNDKVAIEIIKMVETFMLRWHICGRRTSALDDIFPRMTNLSTLNLLAEVKLKLKEKMPDDNEFISRLKLYDFNGNLDRAKYILEQIEYRLMNHHGEYSINSGADVHLEHIIPQKIKSQKSKQEFGDWETYLGINSIKEHEKYVHTIGNLTLIAQVLNIKASNNPFLVKKKEYKKSILQLNKDLVKNYNNFKFNDLKRRAEKLAHQAVAIWNI